MAVYDVGGEEYEIPDDVQGDKLQSVLRGIIQRQKQQPPKIDVAAMQAERDAMANRGPVVPADPDVPITGAYGRAVVRQPEPRPEPTIGEQLIGAGETALTLATGATGGLVGTVGGTARGIGREMMSGEFGTQDAARRISETAAQDAAMLTYSPRTEEGQRYTRAAGEALAPIAAVTPMAGEMAAISAGLKTLPMAGRQVSDAAKTVAANKMLRDAAPTIPQLKDAARAIYSTLDDSGVSVMQPEIGKLAQNIAGTAKREGFNARIHPKVAAALDEISVSSDKNMTLTELDTMRRVARAAARSIDPDEARLGSIVVGKIDDFLNDLPETAIIRGSEENVGPLFKQARGIWQRAKKSEMIADAVEKSKNQASGFENGLRVQFRSILNNKKKMQGFTAQEIDAMQKVVRGGGAENTLKFLGKFGFTEGQATSMIGSSIGVAGGAAAAGPLGAVAVPLIGQLSKNLAQRLTRSNAEFADQIVRAGRDGKAIAFAYLRNTPKNKRSVAELTELLMRPGVNIDTIKPIKNPLINDAAFYIDISRAASSADAANIENEINQRAN